jgi:methyl-accepting chemotaxis protein
MEFVGFRDFKIKTKIITMFLTVGLLSITTVGFLSYYSADVSTSKSMSDLLTTLREVKKNQVEEYFQERFRDVNVLAGLSVTGEALESFKKAHQKSGLSLSEFVRSNKFKELDKKYGPILTEYIKEYGYTDLFLISENGDVLYTVEQNFDLGINVPRGKYANSNLGMIYKKGLKEIILTDFEPYSLSNNVAASFIGGPIKGEGRKVHGIVALQIPIDKINAIMQETSGLGKSGEAYLVGKDLILRSDSRFSQESSVLERKIDTVSVREALAGNTDCKVITGYRDIDVMSAYSPVNIKGMDWIILAEINEKEAMKPVTAIRNKLILATIIIGAIVFAIALFFARFIANPINKVVEVIKKIAKGDLNGLLNADTGDEIGDLAGGVVAMMWNLEKIVGNILASSETVASGANEIAAGNHDLSQRSQEQASAIEETASTIEQMVANIKSNADSSHKASELATKAESVAKKGGEVVSKTIMSMADVTESSKKINDIINVVNEIAFQTNLLALNAAVEAARAGDQGRGFAVVAGEVRNLAGRSAEAAKEIQKLIGDSVEKVEIGNKLVDETGETLKEIIKDIEEVTNVVSEITSASKEQASGIDQVNKSVAQMDEVVQQNASLVEEAAATSEQLSGEAQGMKQLMAYFKVNSEKIKRLHDTTIGGLASKGKGKKVDKEANDTVAGSKVKSDGLSEEFAEF